MHIVNHDTKLRYLPYMETSRSILQEIELPLLKAHNVRLHIKRDDLIHPDVSGNKWRKLKYFVAQYKDKKNQGIITFGGAFSNHLLATAAYCAIEDIPCIGIVRGDELSPDSNETLRDCADLGMQLVFVSRSDYMLKEDRSYKEYLIEQYPGYMIVPEGGSGYLGMLGCQEIMGEIRSETNFDRIIVAQGTTTTSCGILLGLLDVEKLEVVPVLKNFPALKVMKELLTYAAFDAEFSEELLEKVNVLSSFHFGGYAKVEPELISFIGDIYKQTRIKLDPVYTGKAMYALFDQIKKGVYDNETLVFIHTGGLQGTRSYEKEFGSIYDIS